MLPVFSVLFDIQTLTLQCAKARKNLKPNLNVNFLKNLKTQKKINIELMTKNKHLRGFKLYCKFKKIHIL